MNLMTSASIALVKIVSASIPYLATSTDSSSVETPNA